MTLLFFQYGDFGAAYERFKAGEPETYRDQQKSVEFVANLAAEHSVVVVSVCDRPHKETLASNLLSVGLSADDGYRKAPIFEALDDLCPTILICRSPNIHIVAWAAKHQTPMLPAFADTFSRKGLRRRLGQMRLRSQLLKANIPCIANHSLNASRSVADTLRFPENQIVPWDWSRLKTEPHPKQAPDNRPWRLFYAGPLAEVKGVSDCLEAVKNLQNTGHSLRFEFAGAGDLASWSARAKALGVSDSVDFLGTIPNVDVHNLMKAADLVVVPSRHDYAEGLPNTIYETLASRTPLVVSDHPAFQGRLRDGIDCVSFHAGNPASLSECIIRLIDDPELYESLSKKALKAHDRLYIGMEWAELMRAFLKDPQNKTGWVATNSLVHFRDEPSS